MANNRLYIGNKDTLDVFCFTKSEGNTWRSLSVSDLDGFEKVLKTDLIWMDSSSLVIFSESDHYWFEYFFNSSEKNN